MSTMHLLFALLFTTACAQFCPTLHADFVRRQAAAPFNSATPYNESMGTKHVPYIAVTGTKAVVTVGKGTDVNKHPFHPMVNGTDPNSVHFITHIYVLDQDGGFVAMDTLNPTTLTVARMEFEIPAGVTSLQAFEWCNKHGLWEGPKIVVTAGKAAKQCKKDGVDETARISFATDFERRQSGPPWNKNEPYTSPAKHVPFITFSSNNAIVTVGDGNPFHPMVGGSDPSTVHFVTHIYVKDQNGKIVTMQNLDPNGVDKAVITFLVPKDASSLTAYEFCNKHGLWQGPTVVVPTKTGSSTGQTDSGNSESFKISIFVCIASIIGLCSISEWMV